MNSKNMPIVMLVCVIFLAVFAGVFWYFGVDKYIAIFRGEEPTSLPQGPIEVPLPFPPMEQTVYEVEIAIVQAKFAARKAARKGK